MATRNFYFGKNADVVDGSANFAAIIATSFAALGLTTGQQSAFGVLNSALQAAWTASFNADTRTSVTIAARELALQKMRASAIQLAKIIYATPTVTDAQLVSLGLLPRGGRTPSELITVKPVLTIKEQDGRDFTVQVRKVAGRGMVRGALGAVVYTFIGATPPSGVEGWVCEGPITKDTGIISVGESVPVGTKIWFAAQWFNSKGVGPGCTPVAAVVGAAGSLAA